MYRILGICILLLLRYHGYAQNGQYSMGASSSAMSNANINSTDPWSLFNNPAGLGYLSNPSILTSFQNRLNVAAFQTLGFGMLFPVGKVVPGISFYRFGDNVFNQQKLSFSVGSRIQIVSLGASVNIIQNRFSELGNVSAINFEFGGIAEIIDGLRIGAHIFNLNQAQFTVNQPLVVVMRFGLSYVPSDYFIITSELEKELNQPENLKIGFSYFVTEWVSIQSGFASQPQSLSFGLGLHPKTWSFNYAFISISPAGTVHEISLSKTIRRNELQN